MLLAAIYHEPSGLALSSLLLSQSPHSASPPSLLPTHTHTHIYPWYKLLIGDLTLSSLWEDGVRELGS